MTRLSRTLHLIGLVLLAGGLVSAWLMPGAVDPEGGLKVLAAQAQGAYGALLGLALPGLLLLLATGVAQMFLLRLNPERCRWLAVKLALAGTLAGSLLLFQMPTVRELLVSATRAAAGSRTRVPVDLLVARNDGLSLLGIGLVVAIVALSVLRPALRRIRPGPPGDDPGAP